MTKESILSGLVALGVTLGVTLLIGVLLLSLAVVADGNNDEITVQELADHNPALLCQSSEAGWNCYQPTPTPTATATATPIPTETPVPTATATPFGDHCHANTGGVHKHVLDGANGHNHHPSAGAVVPCEPTPTPAPVSGGQYIWVTNTPTP